MLVSFPTAPMSPFSSKSDKAARGPSPSCLTAQPPKLRPPSDRSMPWFCRKPGRRTYFFASAREPHPPCHHLAEVQTPKSHRPPPHCLRPPILGAHNPTVPAADLPVFSALTRGRFW